MTNPHKELYDRAHAAGAEAVDKLIVEPMYVQSGSTVYKVNDGLCGFAWVNLKPANSAFAKWLRAEGLAEKRYGGPGINMWIGAYNQSYEKKRTYAAAFANVLREAGIHAWSESRLD